MTVVFPRPLRKPGDRSPLCFPSRASYPVQEPLEDWGAELLTPLPPRGSLALHQKLQGQEELGWGGVGDWH